MPVSDWLTENMVGSRSRVSVIFCFVPGVPQRTSCRPFDPVDAAGGGSRLDWIFFLVSAVLEPRVARVENEPRKRKLASILSLSLSCCCLTWPVPVPF